MPRRTETRERILEVALDLFNEHGYEKTSLREIAERLGVTKAALYYHFERKEDILLALHLKLHDLIRTMLDDLEAADDPVAAWPALVDRFIDEVLANRPLFLVHQRNERAFQEVATHESNISENEDFQLRFARFFSRDDVPLRDRVRMACSLGAVMSAMAVGDVFGGADPADVVALVRDAARELVT